MRLSKRTGIATAAVVTSAGIFLGASAVPAMAVQNFCSGDACANVAAENLTTVFIHMWPNTSSFKGHFELQDPNGTVYNSGPNTEYQAGGIGATLGEPRVYGYWCVTAWKYNGGNNYTDLGEVCFVTGA